MRQIVALAIILLCAATAAAQSTVTRTDTLIAATQAIVNNGTVSTAVTFATPAGVHKGVVGTTTNHDLQLWANNAARLTIEAGGNVGIGTTDPAYALDTYGGIVSNSGTVQNALTYAVPGGVHIGVVGTLTDHALQLWTNGASRVAITAAGAVGVGVDAPGSLLTIDDAGDLSRETYASQTTGWRITRDGAADFRYLYADKMHVRSFIADLAMANAGIDITAKSVALVHSEFTCPTTSNYSQLIVRDLPSAVGMAVFQNGDWVSLRIFNRSGGGLTVADCVGVVTLDTTYGTSGFLAADSATNRPATQAYSFRRASDYGAICTGTAGSSGAATSTVPAETLVLDYGVSGNGYHEVNAIDGAYAANSPYAQVVTWTTCPVAAYRSVRTRIGNLSGASDYTTTSCGGGVCWGTVFGDLGASNLTIDPTNGIRFRNSTTVLGSLSSSEWILGAAATENMRLTSTALEFRDGSTVLGSLSGGTLTLGQPLTVNNTGQIVIDSDSLGIKWRNNSGSTSRVFTVGNIDGNGSVTAVGWTLTSSLLRGSADGSRTMSVSGNGSTLSFQATGIGGEVIVRADTVSGLGLRPYTNGGEVLGTSSYNWSAVYATRYYSGSTAGVVSGTCSAVTVTGGIVTGCTP